MKTGDLTEWGQVIHIYKGDLLGYIAVKKDGVISMVYLGV